MIVRRFSASAAVLAVVALLLAGLQPASAATQPSYDTLRIDGAASALPYEVWVAWSPLIVAMPDGGAWGFFSAQVVNPDATLGTKKLYTSRFDPATATWRPALALSGGQIQFGPTAVVDGQGTVHLVYTDRVDDQATSFGQIVYRRSTPEGGWTDPVPVAADPNAGHQLSADLLLDRNGGLHVVWQDQRGVDPAAREAEASNADVFSADLGADGAWSAPAQMSVRPDATTNASRPQIATDGERLVAVWSIYDAQSGLATAARLEWSIRPLDGSAGWSQPQIALERANSQIGGKLLDLATDPTGAATLVFGRRSDTDNALFVTRLAAGQTAWAEPVMVATGDRGSFPMAEVAADGTVVVVYNIGSGTTVKVGALVLMPAAPRGSVETVLTAGENGAQGRPAIDLDANGRVWVIYMHEPTGAAANEVRALRGAVIATDLAPEIPPATPVPAATPAS